MPVVQYHDPDVQRIHTVAFEVIEMRFYIVDCFAQEKYQGNQLAVFLPDRPMETQEMQQVAHEIGFSETSFLLSGKQKDGG